MSTPSQKWELNEFNDNDLTYYGGDVKSNWDMVDNVSFILEKYSNDLLCSW